MSAGFLLDENMPSWWHAEIIRQQPHLTVWRVGDPGAPPLQSPDLVILAWCEAHHFLLVTNNRKSMPRHLADHVAQGHHVPGIFVVDPKVDIRELAEQLSLIEGTSLPQEYQDQIRHLPIA